VSTRKRSSTSSVGDGDKLITPKQAAGILAVTPQTVKKYIYSGRLPSSVTPGGHHRVRESAVRALLTPSCPADETAAPEIPANGQNPHLGIMRSLVLVIEQLFDTFEPGHGMRVANHARALARKLGLGHEEQEKTWLAGLLHDVGKLMVDHDLLRKEGRLTDQELIEVRQHSVHGGRILGDVGERREVAAAVRHHHERHDGSGYPDGLAGEDIPTAARIIGIAEAYDSMRSDAAYREAMPHDTALAEVVSGAGTAHDPLLVAGFVQTVN